MNISYAGLLSGLTWLLLGNFYIQAQEVIMTRGPGLFTLDIATGETEHLHTFESHISDIAQNSNNELFVLSTLGERHDHALFRVNEDYSLQPLISFDFWVDQMLMLNDDLIILIDNDHNQWWTFWYTYSISSGRLTPLGNISSRIYYIGYHPLSRTIYSSNLLDADRIPSLPGVDHLAGASTRGFDAAAFYAGGELYAVYLSKLHLVTPDEVIETGVEIPYGMGKVSLASQHLLVPEEGLTLAPALMEVQQELDFPIPHVLSMINFYEEPIEISEFTTDLPIDLEVQLPLTVPPRASVQVPIKFISNTPDTLMGEIQAISTTETITSNLNLTTVDFEALEEEEDFAILGISDAMIGQMDQDGRQYDLTNSRPVAYSGLEIFDFNTEGELFSAIRDELYQMDPTTGKAVVIKRFPGESIVTMTFLNQHEMLAVIRTNEFHEDYEFNLRRINLKEGIDQHIMSLPLSHYRELEYNPIDGKVYLQYFQGRFHIDQIDLHNRSITPWARLDLNNHYLNIAISPEGDVLVLSKFTENLYSINKVSSNTAVSVLQIEMDREISGGDLNIIHREAINYHAIIPTGVNAKVIPNPASRGQTIQLRTLGQSIKTLRFTDLNGKLVPFELEESNTNLEQGIVTLLPKTEPGLYVLYLTGDFGRHIVRIVVNDD